MTEKHIKAIAELAETTRKERLGFSKEESNLVYHYTSLDNAKNIIDSKSLWATHAYYLNDETEVQSGFELIKEVIDQQINSIGTYTNFALQFLHYIKFQLIFHFERDDKKRTSALEKAKSLKDEKMPDVTAKFDGLFNNRTDVFVLSFSQKKDDLRQWVPYANNGKGCALGFDPKSFETLIEREEKPLKQFVKVIYNSDEEKRNYIAAFLQKVGAYIEEFEGSVTEKAGQEIYKELNDGILHQVLQELIAMMVACKPSHYSDEEEWRYFVTINLRSDLENGELNNLHFRVGQHAVIPYIRLSFLPGGQEKITLKEIVMGPILATAPYYKANHYSLELLLLKQKISDCAITSSQISYREM